MLSTDAWPPLFEAARRAARIVFQAVMMMLMTSAAFAAERSCPAVPPIRLELPDTRDAIAHGRPITIVALGSSSTQGSGATSPDRTYPARLAALLRADWPEVSVTVLNRGIGGQTIDAVLSRLQSDVIDARPTLVIWQVGTNEALRGMDPVRFDAMLNEGLTRLTTIGSDIVLMDNQIAPAVPLEATTMVYDSIIAGEARAHGISLFSRTALMRSWHAADPTAGDMIGPDGLHHSDRGYACLAASLDQAIMNGTAPRVATASIKLK